MSRIESNLVTIRKHGKPVTIPMLPGRLWQAYGDDGVKNMPVMTTGRMIGDNGCEIIPLSPYTSKAVNGALRIDHRLLRHPILAWPRQRTIIPKRMLRMHIGDLPPVITQTIIHDKPNPKHGVTRMTGMDPDMGPDDINDVMYLRQYRLRLLAEWSRLA